MQYRFRIHYTREEAEALVPQLRVWLEELVETRTTVSGLENRIGQLLASGQDIGGESVNNWVKSLTRMRAILGEFQRREIQLKDLDQGLVDFPAIIGDREVFLCWEREKDKIGYWHDLDSGYAGREQL